MNSITATPPARPAAADPSPASLNARRVLWMRVVAVPGVAAILLAAHFFYGLKVPVTPITLIGLALIAFNVWTWRQLKGRATGEDRLVFLQILADALALSGILLFAGGASNPFAFLFLLPVVIAAAVLPRAQTWIITTISTICYTVLLLMQSSALELTHTGSPEAMRLHTTGMWVGFVVIAGLVAHFVTRMAETVRERDRKLAELREDALRDERVVAVATVAAGAAHEISTPLATMSVVAGEIARSYPVSEHAELHRQLAVLREQIARCKEALSVMSANAGIVRADHAIRCAVPDFARSVVDEVRRLRPGSHIDLTVAGPGSGPEFVADRALRQAMLNVLHNAVDASPRAVQVRAEWSDRDIAFEVNDRGQGFVTGENPLSRLGASTKSDGLGIGLFLSSAAISHVGGRITAGNNAAGGASVRIDLPLDRLRGSD